MSVEELNLYWKLGERNLHVEKEKDNVIKISITFAKNFNTTNIYLDRNQAHLLKLFLEEHLK